MQFQNLAIALFASVALAACPSGQHKNPFSGECENSGK
jgi:hypothetical protein